MKERSIPSNAGVLNKTRIRILNKFYKTRYVILTQLKKTVLPDEEELTEEEIKKRQLAAQNNKIAVNLNFRDHPEEREERNFKDLDDLQFYLRDSNEEQTNFMSNKQTKILWFLKIPIGKKNELIEDPFLNPAKWMSYLEENIQKITSEKVKLAKYGNGSKVIFSF